MSTAEQIIRCTADEYYELTKDRKERTELLDGEIVALAAPSELHQIISLRLAAAADSFIRGNHGDCKTMIAPFDVVLNEQNIVQPDVLVVCEPSKMDGKRCNGAPDWVIEVTSSNWLTDYREKLELYRETGVREYWIVDTDRRKVWVFDFEQHPNILNIYTWAEEIPVSIFKNALKLCIADLL